MNYDFDSFLHDFMLNQVQFTYKGSVEVSTNASINQYSRFKILKEITLACEQHEAL